MRVAYLDFYSGSIRRLMILFALSIASMVVSSCSLIEDRTFSKEMEKDTEGPFVPGENYPVVNGDKDVSGRDEKEILERTPLNIRDQREKMRNDALVEELKALEDQLPEREYQHFQLYSEKLPSISEKIFFLRLKGIKERNEYLSGRGIYSNEYYGLTAQEELAIRNREIIVGMSKDQVIQSWGRPLRIDVAGNPSNENERWLFYNYGNPQYVFFENGRVRGWMIKQD